jgi:predicted ATPase
MVHRRGKSEERESPPSSSLRRPARGRGHNLPLETTSFVGRAAELDALAAALGSARLVSIVGAPGTGKTRLAQKAADRALGTYVMRGGVWFADLSGTRTRDEACSVIASSIGVASPDASDPVTRLGHALAARGPTLVVLDNFEQLSETTAPALASWLARAPELRFLVTSRERVRVPEEHVFELGPFTGSSAIELWCARAAGFVLDESQVELLSDLLRDLDGLPLAIELCAARYPVLGLSELRQRMRDRLELLAHGPRTRDTRQATLRGALDWSYELLSAEERRAFAACGAFVSGFSLDALEAVLSQPALRHVQALCDKSLLVPQPGLPARFRMYRSILAYAHEKLLELDDAATLLARHAEWLAKTGVVHAERFELHANEESWHWLSTEIDDLIVASERALEREGASETALRLVLVSEAVLSRRGPPTLLRALVDRALADPGFESARPGFKARILRAKATHEKNLGYPARSLELLGRAESEAEAAGDRGLWVEIVAEAAFVEQSQGALERAAELFSRAETRVEGLGDPRVRGRVLAGVGLLHHSQGRLDLAHAAYDEAMRFSRVARDPWTEASLEKDLGTLRLQEGRLDEAREHYARALLFEARLGIPTFGAVIAGNLGILEQERGDLTEARACFENALETFRHTGSRLLEGHTLGYLAGLDLECDAHSEASDRYQSAIEVLREVGDRRSEGVFWAARGAAEAIRDREAAAAEAFARAEPLLNEVGDPGLIAALRLHRAQLILSRARTSTDPSESARLREDVAIVARAARNENLVEKSDDARFALRILDRELARSSLVWDDAASTLTLPSGEVVTLEARLQLRRLVVALGDHRMSAPGSVLTEADLLAAGWPGEKMAAAAAQNRVKVALSTLRKLGMRDVIVHQADGWMLDPSLPLHRK